MNYFTNYIPTCFLSGGGFFLLNNTGYVFYRLEFNYRAQF